MIPCERASRPNAVGAFDERHEFAKKEIAVKGLAIPRIDVERVPSVRSHHQEIAHLAVAAQILQRRPFSDPRPLPVRFRRVRAGGTGPDTAASSRPRMNSWPAGKRNIAPDE